jgi:hypothetical protein
MGRFTKRVIIGLAAACMTVGGAFAQSSLIDDLEHGGNTNYFGAYWYMYEEAGAKLSNFADPFLPVDGGRNSDFAAKLIFSTLPAHSEDDNIYPEAAMATQLTVDSINGMGAGFNDASAFKFWGKASKATNVWFKVETVENSAGTHDGGNGPSVSENVRTYNSYGVSLAFGSDWEEFEVKIADCNANSVGATVPGGTAGANNPKAGDLQQGQYWGAQFNFRKARITKLGWAVKSDANVGWGSGSVEVDDISVVGYTFVAKDMCNECVAAPSAPSNSMLFSNFEESFMTDYALDNTRQNRLGWYWYYYSDSEAGGSSDVTGLFTEDPYTEEIVLDVDGNGNGGNGAAISFTMGAPFKQNPGDPYDVQPFVGIGTGLFNDELQDEYYNGTANGATGVYFEYNTTGIKELVFEVEDMTSSIGDNGGEVYYLKVPGTDGAWRGATIPFNKLVLPTWATNRTSALDLSRLAKFQFKYQGGGNGSMALDNVYIIGAGDPISVKLAGNKARTTGLRAAYSRGSVNVSWNAASSVASGKIQLVNTKGRVVATSQIAKASGSRITANIGAGKIPTGMYFVRIDAKDASGKRIVQQAPISIVK